MAIKSFEENGVGLSKKTLYGGDRLKIIYNGLLAGSGAENIYLHSGYGSEWSHSTYTQMHKEAEGFSAEIQILDGKSLQLCFKDSADNWDNNSGANYVFKISARRSKKAGTGI